MTQDDVRFLVEQAVSVSVERYDAWIGYWALRSLLSEDVRDETVVLSHASAALEQAACDMMERSAIEMGVLVSRRVLGGTVSTREARISLAAIRGIALLSAPLETVLSEIANDVWSGSQHELVAQIMLWDRTRRGSSPRSSVHYQHRS